MALDAFGLYSFIEDARRQCIWLTFSPRSASLSVVLEVGESSHRERYSRQRDGAIETDRTEMSPEHLRLMSEVKYV